MWRNNRDESRLSLAELIAWEYVLPYKHVPIIGSDSKEVKKLVTFLERVFSTEELEVAVGRIKRHND